MKKQFFAMISVLGLAACGGGGGGDTFETPEDDVRTLTGSSAPLETVGAQSARAASILSRSDSLLFSTAYGNTTLPDVPSFRVDATCSGTRCILREPQSGVYRVITPADLRFIPATEVIALSKHGITLFGGEADIGKAYGSWMRHSAFQVQAATQMIEGETVWMRHAKAGGDLTGYAPDFSASWQGVMVGTPATGSERGDFLQGDAFLSYGSNASGYAEIDAAFTNIKNIDKNRSHSVASIRFDDVPVFTDGTFEAGLTGNHIQGGFYGPGYAEATGVFEQRNVVGAFGARKR